MNLVIDVGNTSVKLAVFKDALLFKKEVVMIQDLLETISKIKEENKTIKNVNNMIVSPLIEKESCGTQSKVVIVKESYMDIAIEIAQYFNITFEPSGISGLALLLQMLDCDGIKLNQNDKVIIINTGKSIISNYY